MKNTIIHALDSLEYKYLTSFDDETRTVFRFGISMNHGRCDTIIDLQTDDNHVLIYVVWPMFVPPNKRDRIADFLTRANYGIIIGNFEMDYDDGEIRYKSSFVYDSDTNLSNDVFIRYLNKSFSTFDKYLPGIISVMYAALQPSDAIAQVENTENPALN